MRNLRLDPFLYRDECEEHGKNVKFIVEPQEVDFSKKEVRFVFYCKKCWHEYGENASAWRGVLPFKEYNDFFGYILVPDN
jgi:hypothetical protein